MNFGDSLPYDIVIGFKSDDYNTLINSGVKVTENDPTMIDKVCVVNDKYEFKSGSNRWLITGGALVGVIAAVGGAVGVGIHHKRAKDRRGGMQQLNNYSSFDSYSSSSSSFGRRY